MQLIFLRNMESFNIVTVDRIKLLRLQLVSYISLMFKDCLPLISVQFHNLILIFMCNIVLIVAKAYKSLFEYLVFERNTIFGMKISRSQID